MTDILALKQTLTKRLQSLEIECKEAKDRILTLENVGGRNIDTLGDINKAHIKYWLINTRINELHHVLHTIDNG
jgi:hypothetical protein